MKHVWIATLAFVGGCGFNPNQEGPSGSLVGTYELTTLGDRCDTYAAGGGFDEGGKFTVRKVGGWMTFQDGDVVTHTFEIAGTCTLPDGSHQDVQGTREEVGRYQLQGGNQVEITHSGVDCTGSYSGDRFTVVTGTLFPPVRFWYTLQKRPSVGDVNVAEPDVAIAPGATHTFSASTLGADGAALPGRIVRWASSDASVASIDAHSGVVTAIREGETTIEATSEGKVGRARVVVARVSQTP